MCCHFWIWIKVCPHTPPNHQAGWHSAQWASYVSIMSKCWWQSPHSYTHFCPMHTCSSYSSWTSTFSVFVPNYEYLFELVENHWTYYSMVCFEIDLMYLLLRIDLYQKNCLNLMIFFAVEVFKSDLDDSLSDFVVSVSLLILHWNYLLELLLRILSIMHMWL